MHAKRAQFKKDILCEFLPPNKPSNKVIVFAVGMPGMPSSGRLFSVAKQGFWGFLPRYRGSWESAGEFLKEEPTKDIQDIIESLDKPFTSVWGGEEYVIEHPEIYIIGTSFGGPAALLLSKHPKVKKVICISPVVDWLQESEDEPLAWLGDVTLKSFGEAYRYTKKNWMKLLDGTFYNPAGQLEKVDGNKVMIIHAKDDTIVLPGPVEEFAKKIGANLIMKKKGGHLGSKILSSWWMMRKIKKFMSA